MKDLVLKELSEVIERQDLELSELKSEYKSTVESLQATIYERNELKEENEKLVSIIGSEKFD